MTQAINHVYICMQKQEKVSYKPQDDFVNIGVLGNGEEVYKEAKLSEFSPTIPQGNRIYMDLMERNFLNSTRITSSHLSSIYGKNKKEGIQAIYFGEVMLNGTNSD